MYDAVVIGGGFYGAAIAVYLTRHRSFAEVALVERESALLTRASHNNQARIHSGYHYPRSFTTAFRSRIDMPRFMRDYPAAVKQDFTKLYAVARRNSKVTARQFERFCRHIGANVEPASASLRALFEPRLVEEVFLTEEYAFDATQLARQARQELDETGVEVRLNTCGIALFAAKDGLRLRCADVAGEQELTTRLAFNCTYSGLNQLGGDFSGSRTKLKHEISEVALVEAPSALTALAVTVIDGPFFSLMPFPSRGLHALSHVRYTPHLDWVDQAEIDPYRKLDQYDRVSRVGRMLRDAARYMPAIIGARHVDSLFEVKTVLVKNEGDDGRPILFERHAELPGCYSILGGKIDNIYDVLERLDLEVF